MTRAEGGPAAVAADAQAAPQPEAAGDKLRVLCLHGYMQNAEVMMGGLGRGWQTGSVRARAPTGPPLCTHAQVFRSRLGSMRKALKSRAEFVFVDAPHEERSAPALGGGEEQQQAVEERRGVGRTW